MSQLDTNQSQASEVQDQTEFSLEVSKGKARLELSISSQQGQKFLRATGLLISHLLAASLGSSVSLDDALLNLPAQERPSMSAPASSQTTPVPQ